MEEDKKALFGWRGKHALVYPDEIPVYDDCIYCGTSLAFEKLYEYEPDEEGKKSFFSVFNVEWYIRLALIRKIS